MPLQLVATPIGNPQDISLRGLEILKSSEIIILEEHKESTAFLRSHGIKGKPYEQLNEHTTPEDVARLAELCAHHMVALITDCGTPGFADPGADLVRACRKNGTSVIAAPGPSSLMTLLSLSSQRLSSFFYRGFLPAENEERAKEFQILQKNKNALVIMDTPYRLQKTLLDLNQFFSGRRILIGVDLTQTTETVLEGSPKQVMEEISSRQIKKAEFIVLIYPG